MAVTLLEKGHKMNEIYPNGKTPLHMACELFLVPVLNYFLETSVDASIQDFDGKLAIDCIPILAQNRQQILHLFDLKVIKDSQRFKEEETRKAKRKGVIFSSPLSNLNSHSDSNKSANPELSSSTSASQSNPDPSPSISKPTATNFPESPVKSLAILKSAPEEAPIKSKEKLMQSKNSVLLSKDPPKTIATSAVKPGKTIISPLIF